MTTQLPIAPLPRSAPYTDEQDAFRIYIERIQRHRAAACGPPSPDRVASHASALAAEAAMFGPRRVAVW